MSAPPQKKNHADKRDKSDIMAGQGAPRIYVFRRWRQNLLKIPPELL
jgi:hypothetical protein